jgi:hypothetical protein
VIFPLLEIERKMEKEKKVLGGEGKIEQKVIYKNSKLYLVSYHPLTQCRILVPYIPFYVYDCNRPLAPILRQKMELPGV